MPERKGLGSRFHMVSRSLTAPGNSATSIDLDVHPKGWCTRSFGGVCLTCLQMLDHFTPFWHYGCQNLRRYRLAHPWVIPGTISRWLVILVLDNFECFGEYEWSILKWRFASSKIWHVACFCFRVSQSLKAVPCLKPFFGGVTPDAAMRCMAKALLVIGHVSYVQERWHPPAPPW